MPTSPSPLWVSASAPKRGNRAEENEDAAAASPDGLRFAVCDGASEGWESRPWAARLATSFLKQPPEPPTFDPWLAGVRRTWTPPEPSGAVPWYASVKQEQGSFATLAGLDLRRAKSGPGWTWRAVAVGDSCLFHVRGGKLLAAFPVDSPAGFGNQPRLVPSSVATACPEPDWLAGRADPGDLFLLATDAVAATILTAGELAEALGVVRAALAARAADPLLDWFGRVQSAHNDDASLIAVRLPEAPEAP